MRRAEHDMRELVRERASHHARKLRIPRGSRRVGGDSLPQRERDDVRSGRDGDVLPLIEDVGHRRRLPVGVRVEPPHRRAVRRIHGGERSAVVGEEHEATGRRQRPAPGRCASYLRHFPPDLAGAQVDRAQELLPGLVRAPGGSRPSNTTGPARHVSGDREKMVHFSRACT